MSKKISMLKCPFVVVGVSAVIALLSDITWLIFDVMIKTKEFWAHPYWYGSILTGLSLATIILIIGVYLYSVDGLLKHEKRIIHKQEQYENRKNRIAKR